MKFQNKLRKFFQRTFQFESPYVETINPKELLGRFIFDKRHIKNRCVRAAAFLPPKKNLKTSVYRISSINEDEIWDIARKYVVPYRKKPVIALAKIKVCDVQNENLSVKSVPTPHHLHADIVNWPNEPEERKKIAAELALRASISEYPNAGEIQ